MAISLFLYVVTSSTMLWILMFSFALLFHFLLSNCVYTLISTTSIALLSLSSSDHILLPYFTTGLTIILYNFKHVLLKIVPLVTTYVSKSVSSSPQRPFNGPNIWDVDNVWNSGEYQHGAVQEGPSPKHCNHSLGSVARMLNMMPKWSLVVDFTLILNKNFLVGFSCWKHCMYFSHSCEVKSLYDVFLWRNVHITSFFMPCSSCLKSTGKMVMWLLIWEVSSLNHGWDIGWGFLWFFSVL